jgi:methylenetetrahydrofolate reductase (NADPH)
LSFREKLLSGKFIITGEISPPKGTDTSGFMRNADLIRECVDAINITDNQRAVMRMSPLAACIMLEQRGYETIMHLTCRDRNRLALQSELLGAYAHGIKNVLVMSGDHPTKGDHAGAKPIYDLDSVQLLGLIQSLNRGFDLSGSKLEGGTDFCTGAVTNTELNEVAFIKLEKKIKVGIQFIQTQAVFDTDNFSELMEKMDEFRPKGIKIIAGVIPLRSEKNASFLNNNIAGIKVPEDIISQMRAAKDPETKGMEIAAELIKELRSMCHGVHIMPIVSHENTWDILEMAGLR